MRCNQKTNKLS